MLYEITSAVARPNHTLAVTWSDGVTGIVDMTSFIGKGELFSALQDPDYFIQNMRLLPGGAGISWPNEIDFSADGLRHDAFPQEESGEFEETIVLQGEFGKTQPPSHEVR